MKIERPQFELTRVNADGKADAPEIVPVTEMPWDTRMNRRGLLGVGVGAAAALFLLDNQAEANQSNIVRAPERPPLAHSNYVTALALTPDGRMLISASHDNTVKLWAMPEGAWLATLPAHTGDVTRLAITPDGKMLVTASADALRLHTLPDGQLQAVLDAHTDIINAIAITPDGKMLVSASNDKTARVWSLPEGRLIATLEGHSAPVRTLALAPDGRLLATGGKDNRLRIWSLPEARLLMTLSGYSSERFAITPDSRMIAIASYEIALRSLSDGRLMTTIRPGVGETNDLAISPDGKILVSSSRETLFLWSLPDGKQLRRLDRAGYSLGGFIFSPDSRVMMSSGGYDSGRLWSLPDGQMIGQLQTGNQLSAALFTSERLVTGGGNGSIAIWNTQPPGFRSYMSDPAFTASKSPDRRMMAHNGAITALTISSDGRMLASSSSDNTAKLWSLPGGQLLATIEGHRENINDVAILPDGKTVITAAGDRTIKLWALPDTAPPAPAARKSDKKSSTARPQTSKTSPKGRLLATLEGHQTRVQRLLVSTDGKTLVSADSNGAIKIWSLPEGRLQTTLPEPRNDLKAIAISPDGKLLVTTATITTTTRDSVERSVSLWSLPEGRLVTTMAGHQSIRALAIAPDGKRLIVACDDHNLRIWELPTGRLIGSMEGINATALAFTSDGKLMAASAPGYITLWQMDEGRMIAAIEERREGYGNIEVMPVFASDGKRLLSLAANGGIRIWSSPECRLQATIETQLSNIKAAALSPNGKTLATGDYSGVITLWDLDKPGFRTYLFDAAANTPEIKGITYNVYDQVTGQTITYTLPCGSPIPPGAVCVCNCVPGTERAARPPAPSPRRSTGGGRSSGGRSGGTYCTCNKICTCIPVPSDRNVKDEFETIDPLLILQRLSELPIQKWNYKWDDAAIRHIGPMAQDFAAAFDVGEDDKHIHPVDAQGVAFAAIQGLYRMTQEKQRQIETLKEQLCAQQEENDTLRRRIEALERRLR
ncbi:MAG: tail fiber domain-containing protein [Acidobacteriota bacterium]